MTWHVPTRGRPALCQGMLDALVARGATAPGVIWCNEDDEALPEYRALRLPPGWEMRTVVAGVVGASPKLRQAFADFPSEPWYGVLTDDLGLETDGFERALIDTAGPWGIASGDDGWQAREDVAVGRLAGAVVFGGELLRALGYWAPAGWEHLYFDDVWEKIGRELGVWRCVMAVRTTHSPAPYQPGATMDATCARVNAPTAYAAGEQRFRTWLATEAEADITRARLAHWEAQGLSIERARKRSVMLAFPVYDRPHHQHEAAAMATVALLTQLGIRCGFAHAHQQPVHSARNMLTAAFLASDLTDLLFIDSDICWDAWSVVRLLAQRHPYIGAIGIKRSPYPLTDRRAWCFGAAAETPEHDASGAFEVKYIGTGFLLLNRLVFEAIEKHGNAERVLDADGTSHTRFFKWGFEDGAEIGEDCALSLAYRAIGGKVMADPTICLTHFGAEREHRGRLSDLLLASAP